MVAIDDVINSQTNSKKTPSEWRKNKLLSNPAKGWDIFYKRNTTNFFKDRHWTCREFPELLTPNSRLLEVGCGVGNFVFPLLDENPSIFVYACDFSKRAIDLVRQSSSYNPQRCNAFVCDLANDELSDSIPAESIDMVSCIFVLSAIPPADFGRCIANMARILKPGGTILFRDYGLHDAAQLRFKAENYMGEQFYVRSDDTFSFFFSIEDVQRLFCDAGFDVIENRTVLKEVVNRKQDMRMDRVFVQAKLRKR